MNETAEAREMERYENYMQLIRSTRISLALKNEKKNKSLVVASRLFFSAGDEVFFRTRFAYFCLLTSFAVAGVVSFAHVMVKLAWTSITFD